MCSPMTKVVNAIYGRQISMVFGVLVMALLVILSPRQASAQAITTGPVNEAFSTVNPCNGEPVVITAKTTTSFYFRTDTAGGIHTTIRIKAHGEGTNGDLLNPRKYQFSTENVLEENLPASGSKESTLVLNYVLVRQGNDTSNNLPTATTDDFMQKDTVHITMNSNGIVTASFVRGHGKCLTQ